MKKLITMILCLVLALSMLAGCTMVNVAKAGTVNGDEIPLGLYKYAMKFAEIYFGEYDANSKFVQLAYNDGYTSVITNGLYDIATESGLAGGATIDEGTSLWDKAYKDTTVGEAVKASVFEEIAKYYVAEDLATEKGIILSEEDLDGISKHKAALYKVMGSKSSLDEALKEVNLTLNQLEDFWKKILLYNKLYGEYAEENAESLEEKVKSEYVRVKHILVKVGDEGIETLEDAKKKADEILGFLASGDDFETLMTTYSSDVDQEGNVNGGEEGYVFAKNGGMVKPFEDASFALGIDEYTKEAVEVTQSAGGGYEGYHIIKRFELSENSIAQNKAIVAAEEFETYIDGVAATAQIEKNESKVKGVKLYKNKK